MKVCFAGDKYVVVYKPHGLPTVPLATSDGPEGTLLGEVSLLYPKVLEVHGKNAHEGGALHRLDNATSGLVLFALDQTFYDKIWKAQKEGKFIKTYEADINNPSKAIPFEISTCFRAFGRGRKLVKAETDIKKADSPVLYTTRVKRLSETKVECTIVKGFRHQIRSHLAYIGCPITGDELYGGKEDDYLHLECIRIEFPFEGKTLTYAL